MILREHFRRDGLAKVAYPDPDPATTAARKARGSNRRPYRGYQCSVCRLWHVGRKPVSKSQKAAARRVRRRLEGRP